MDSFENSVQLRLRAEAQAAPSPELLRDVVLSGLRGPTRRRSNRLYRFAPALAVFAVVAVLAAGLVSSRLLDDSTAGNEVSPAAQPSTGQPSTPTAAYTAEELAAGTEQLLTASRAGDVPQITFVRNEPALTGLIVAVPQDTLDQLGTAELEETFSRLVRIPTTIEVAELPHDGLPIRPTPSTPSG